MRHPIRLLVATCLAVVLLRAAVGQDGPPPGPLTDDEATAPRLIDDRPKANSVALTIYSSATPARFDPRVAGSYGGEGYTEMPGFGVVREVRTIDLEAGENAVRVPGVAAGIDATTVAFESLTAPDTTAVLEQSFEYDVVTADRLLERYLGKRIVLERRTNAAREAAAAARGAGAVKDPGMLLVEGELLSYDSQNVVVQDPGGGVHIVARREDLLAIRLAGSARELVTRPTLVWNVRAKQAGPHQARVSYQTDGLTWRADYRFVLDRDRTAADVSSWVSIVNGSGTGYDGATLKLVAGDVQRIRTEPLYRGGGGLFGDSRGGGEEEDVRFEEKPFFEYHLYTLSRPTSLPNNSTKQLELFPARQKVPVTTSYVYFGAPSELRWGVEGGDEFDRELGTDANHRVDVYVEMDNTEENRMGIPLPAGRIRVYQRDEADGLLEFGGEDVIEHTPAGDPLRVRVGSAFDITGDRRQTDFAAAGDGPVGETYDETFEVTVRNRKATPVRVTAREKLYRWRHWEITEASEKWEKVDAQTVHFPLDIPAGGERKVTYTVRYTRRPWGP